jgi:chromosome segregation ATPase
VNGKHSTEKDIKALMSLMSIDVDNLCTFMAQDKVGDFTTQSNEGMLKRTLQCIEAVDAEQNPLGKTLYEVQMELNDIELMKKSKGREVEAKRQAFENVSVQLEGMKKEVERVQRRDDNKRLKEKYELKLTVVKSTELKQQSQALQELVDAATKDLKDAEAAILPLEEKERNLKRQLQMQEKEKGNAAKTILKTETIISANKKNITETSAAIDDITVELNDILKRRKGLQVRKEENQAQSNKLSKLLREKEPLVPKAKEELNRVVHLREAAFKEKGDLEEAVHGLKEEQMKLDRESKRLVNEMKNFKDPRQIYLDKMRKSADLQDESDCLQFVASNPQKFEQEVIGPIGMYINVKDPEAALLVNQTLQKFTMNAFIVRTERDLQTFRNITTRSSKGRSNRVKVYKIERVNASGWDHIGSAYSQEQLQEFEQFGFRNFLGKYIECNDVVKTFLLTQSRPTLETLYARADSRSVLKSQHLSSICPGGAGPNSAQLYLVDTSSKDQFKRFDTYQYRMNFSRWNKQQGQSSSSMHVNYQETNFLAGGGLDEDDNATKEIERRLADISTTSKATRARTSEALDRVKAKDKEFNDLSKKKIDLQMLIKLPADARAKVDRISKTIRDLDKQLSENQNKERSKLEKAYKDSLSDVLDSIDLIADRSVDCVNLHVEVVIEQERRKDLERALDDASEELEEAKEGLGGYKERKATAISNAKHKKDEMDEWLDKLEVAKAQFADAKAFVAFYKGEVTPACQETDVADIELRIDELSAQIENVADNAGIMEKYAEKSAEEQQLRVALGRLEAELENSAEKVESQSQNWIMQVMAIVEKVNKIFGENMSKLKFDGEVKFNRKGTFSQYELQLMVAFKENTSMSILDGQKHSGGERAVSTIMYLMALQNLISAPFRSVDEINQGMDERNERLVFDQIVTSSTGASIDSQYFLVSPKLLQGLRSMEHEDVTVLMIWNGPGVRSKWQLSEMISKIKKRKGIKDITNGSEGYYEEETTKRHRV